MEKRGLNQAQIAGRMDTEQAAISKLLRSKQQLTDTWMLGFAEALDIEVADIFRDPNAPTQNEILEGLTYDQKETVTQLISVMREKKTTYKS